MMEWNTEQYARLFRIMSAMFWRHPMWCTKPRTNWFDGLSLWRRYLEELGINDGASWEELCDSIKINVLHDQCNLHRRVGTLPNGEPSTSFTAVLAAHDQENVFITDPSINSDYSEFENWSVRAIPWEPQILDIKSLLDFSSRPKGGELLTIPKDTAENILVLGLP